jgi:hypothetical protein
MKKEQTEFKEIRKQYPVSMTKDQFYRITHISKKTALYLLISGLVPCVDSGKKTRKYTIKTDDVINYLVDRKTNPAKYTAPDGWYAGRSGKYPPITSYRSELLTLSNKASERFMSYLTLKLSGAEDLLSIPQVSALTGYSTKTLYRWCREKGIKHFRISNRVLIPKIILINYLSSEDANMIRKKSAVHLALIHEFLRRYKRIR